MVIAAGQLPAHLEWEGEVLFDQDKMFHRKYHATTAKIILVRPDGYIAFRATGFGGSYLEGYLGWIFR